MTKYKAFNDEQLLEKMIKLKSAFDLFFFECPKSVVILKKKKILN